MGEAIREQVEVVEAHLVAAGNLGNLILPRERTQSAVNASRSTAVQAHQDGAAGAVLGRRRAWSERRASTCPYGGHQPHRGTVGGLRNPLRPGQTVMLERCQNKFQFRVVWTNQLGPGEIQAGIESVAFERKVWGVDLPDQLTSPGVPIRETTPPGSIRHSERG